MLMLLFQLGDSRYAIPVAEVVEVAPRVQLDSIDKVPAYIAGLFNYRGRHVPVVDLCHLIKDRPCTPHFTTRIVLVDFPSADGNKRLLGLLGERITETVDIDPGQFSETGLNREEAPYLGQAVHSQRGLIQHVSIRDLLPLELQAQLFAAEC